MNNVIEKYCNFFIAHFGLNIAKYRQRNYYSIFFKTNIQYITMKHLFILIVVCFTSATSFANSNSINNNSDSANYYYAKAKESRSQRKVFDAEKFFQKALEFDANNDEIRIEFAEYYIEMRKYALATIQYRTILKDNPTHKIALPKYIGLCFLQRKWVEVIKNGEIALTNNIKVENINFMMGKSYYEEEDYGKARKYLTTQFKQNPKHKETVILLGRVYIEMSMYNDAIAMYKQAIESNPDDYEILYEIGLLYSAQNNDREAVKYFEMAADKGIKQDLAFLQNLGMAYLSFNIPKGVEVLNKVLEKKPGDVEILTQIAQAYYKAQDYGTAYELYFKIFENDNSNAKALYMAGVSLIRKGDKNRGTKLCDKAIAMEPKLGELRSQKSVL
ncbi:MAG TPA: DUF2989 domain-containing protein [Chitinophagaceae bacterium]|nr:DUF2989 domain-containing protein [Chitinophagaceae bacterium]MCC6635440.1 DUF2989 domain-containing protein [Chitinophagaceae bacterium]HMZ45749.1 DUF2989 domain-containing protein [Chitinophagaceae bacterium]HNE93252.1 DUF2989 domain-containing protein [Chitinophagaceae bacterium]HNL81847.1 DUF2989 domain-containing protein [Chitinophagaceae bacterium]